MNTSKTLIAAAMAAFMALVGTPDFARAQAAAEAPPKADNMQQLLDITQP